MGPFPAQWLAPGPRRQRLDLTRDTTDALRAQAHEFSNRMHVVSGLIELGEYDEARGYVRHIGKRHNGAGRRNARREHQIAPIA